MAKIASLQGTLTLTEDGKVDVSKVINALSEGLDEYVEARRLIQAAKVDLSLGGVTSVKSFYLKAVQQADEDVSENVSVGLNIGTTTTNTTITMASNTFFHVARPKADIADAANLRAISLKGDYGNAIVDYLIVGE